MKKIIIRLMAGTSVLAILAIAGIGFLHTPYGKTLPVGKRIMASLSSLLRMKCPIDLDHLDARQVELSREKGVASFRGSKPAPARPSVADLKLDQTNEQDAWTWVKQTGIECTEQIRGMHFIKCSDLPPSKLGETTGKTPINMLTLAFAPSGKLVAVDIFRRQLSATEASQVMETLSAKLKTRLGSPTQQMGSISKESLDVPVMKTSFIHYEYQNYLAFLTATMIPWSGGVSVHEQYSTIY